MTTGIRRIMMFIFLTNRHLPSNHTVTDGTSLPNFTNNKEAFDRQISQSSESRKVTRETSA